jgi:calcineurin-like phosphoesterase family protein
MNAALINNWNNKVQPGDTVYHLGDFAFKGAVKNFIPMLAGNIILVRGNHDKTKDDKYFYEVVDGAVVRVGRFTCYLTHVPPTKESMREEKYLENAWMVKDHQFVLCGHVHELWTTSGNCVNVGVDRWNMAPISEEVLEQFLIAEKEKHR